MDEDWSDSDEEVLSEIETSVLLGVPDGPIDKETDVSDAAVSRIGGHPAFLPSREPLFSSSFCKICSSPMELLVQMWCPFEKSPMDRALYIWGCPRSGCQTKAGSVRAWRGLRYNEQYAIKLDKQRAKQKPKPPVVAKQPHPGLFGLGAQIFGGDASVPSPAPDLVDDDPDSDAESKYLPAQPKAKLPAGAQVSDPDEEPKGGKDVSWAFEPYENSLEVDHAFERFTKRVAFEGEQCVRADSKATNVPKRDYNPSRVDPCPFCKSKRIFECQLMPNLINVLRKKEDVKKMSDEDRRKAVEKALKRAGDKDEKSGMEWGTCLVFSCEKDCRVDENGADERDVWKEEVVLIQWDS
ncbi:programmed cell death protein 2 [Mycena floridula]|nr:programmed cell death protein 2 [Mycena floridula]